MKIAVSRHATDSPAEPYVWYDDRGDEPGWVLRYSLSPDVGRCHLDEPLEADALEDADGAIAQAQQFLGGSIVLPHDGVTEWADCAECGRRLDPANDAEAPEDWDGSCYYCGAAASRVGLRV